MGIFPDTVPGLASVYDHEGLWWCDPYASAGICFWHLQLDAHQAYGRARTGAIHPPYNNPANPYWVGRWVQAGWAILAEQQSAWDGPPYRLFLTTDPWYVALLCNARYDPWYAIVDAPPELAAAASRMLGVSRPGGYGLVEKTGSSTVAYPNAPQLPGVPTLPVIPTLPGGYATTIDPIPASSVTGEPRTEPVRPSQTATPPWLWPAVGAFGGVAVLWYLQRTGRI